MKKSRTVLDRGQFAVQREMEKIMSKYETYRRQYPVFYYRRYELEEDAGKVCLQYFFEIPGLSEFSPKWIFPKAEHDRECYGKNPTFRRMAFFLGMTELVSYWKIACPPSVVVEAGSLDEAQIAWWKNLYYNGLGEFFYTNGIEADPETFLEIQSAGAPEPGEERPLVHPDGCLIPVGGGKDSAVTIELLKESQRPSCCYIINPRGASLETARAGGYRDGQIVSARRTLDARMIALNRQGFLNGHTPFSAIVAFSSVMAAYMRNLHYVVLSNESSANESTVPGSTVNHQYSKSFQFEQDFHAYEETYIKSGIFYFSLLRPLSEFQIARYFSKCTAYHDLFRSCNVGSREDVWCGHCPKCLFVCLILSPFLPEERIREIFGRDLLNDEALIGTMEKLTGIQQEKPFECVGSRGEVNTALCLTIARMEAENKPLPIVLAAYQKTALYAQYQKRKDGYSSGYDDQNLLPDEFDAIVRRNCVLPPLDTSGQKEKERK